MGRIAVIKEFRKNKIGTLLVKEMINYSKNYFSNFKNIIIHSQTQAIEFYEKIGFRSLGKFHTYERQQESSKT